MSADTLPAGGLGVTFARLAGFRCTRPRAMAASLALGLLTTLLGLASQLGVAALIIEALVPEPDRQLGPKLIYIKPAMY